MAGPLDDSEVGVRIPAEDLERARAFYSEKLGLEVAEERPGGLRYVIGGQKFTVFQSAGKPSGAYTQMGVIVSNRRAAMAELRDRGVEFLECDLPGLKTEDGIAEIEGNYPSSNSRGELAAWFHDSEGNLLGIGQAL